MPPFWRTLKFWLALSTVGYLIAKHYLPNVPFLTEEWFQGVVLTLVVWLIGDPLARGLRIIFRIK